jgi:hypothetical protein
VTLAAGCGGKEVEIEQRLDRMVWMRWQQRRLQLERCPAEKKASYQAAWTPPRFFG